MNYLRWLPAVAVAGAICFRGVTCAAASVHGAIFVTSLPAGAAVWMDGSYLGETPLFVDSVDSGRHAITLIHGGWSPQSQYTDVSAGHVATLSVVLAQSGAHAPASHAKGALVVRAPAGAAILLDGAPLAARNEVQAVDAGDHILSISRPGGPRTTQIAHIYAQITTVVAQLPPSAASFSPSSDEQVLVPLDQYVPANNYTLSGDTLTIHFRGVEVECAMGSKSYTLNGKPGTLNLAPAMLAKKAYLPLSLLKRIIGISKTAAR